MRFVRKENKTVLYCKLNFIFVFLSNFHKFYTQQLCDTLINI